MSRTYNVLLDKPRFVWFECNSQAILDEWKLVATSWQAIGYLAATTREASPGQVADFIAQMLAVPGVNGVMSGFKLADFFSFPTDSYLDQAIWGNIKTLADTVYAATGNPVILDNETNLVNLRDSGTTVVDPVALAAALDAVGPWPPVWHWSAPIGETEPLRQMTWDWATGVRDGMKDSGSQQNAHVIESNSAGYVKSPTDPELIENVERTFGIDPTPLSIVYLDDVSTSFWDLAEAWQTIQYVRGKATILYPGYGDLNNHAAVQASYDLAPDPTYRVRIDSADLTYRVALPQINQLVFGDDTRIDIPGVSLPLSADSRIVYEVEFRANQQQGIWFSSAPWGGGNDAFAVVTIGPGEDRYDAGRAGTGDSIGLTPDLALNQFYEMQEFHDASIFSILVSVDGNQESQPLAVASAGVVSGIVIGEPIWDNTFLNGVLKNFKIYDAGDNLIHHWPIDDGVADGGQIVDVVGGAHGTLTLGSGSWETF